MSAASSARSPAGSSRSAPDSETAAGVILMLGTGAGLAIAAAGTASWDAKPPPVAVTPAVLEGPSRSKGYRPSAGFSF